MKKKQKREKEESAEAENSISIHLLFFSFCFETFSSLLFKIEFSFSFDDESWGKKMRWEEHDELRCDSISLLPSLIFFFSEKKKRNCFMIAEKISFQLNYLLAGSGNKRDTDRYSVERVKQMFLLWKVNWAQFCFIFISFCCDEILFLYQQKREVHRHLTLLFPRQKDSWLSLVQFFSFYSISIKDPLQFI